MPLTGRTKRLTWRYLMIGMLCFEAWKGMWIAGSITLFVFLISLTDDDEMWE